MKRFQLVCVMIVFIVGIASGLGMFISVPILRFASLTSVLRAKFVSCEQAQMVGVYEGSPQQRCFNKQLVSMVKAYGISSTITALRSYMKTPNGSHLQGMRCHAMAHEIGNAAARFGTPSDVLMTQCIGLCDFGQGTRPVEGIDLGCMNGAGHTWVLMNPDVGDAFGKCAVPSIPDSVRQGCYHGIGHGLSERYGVDFVSAVNQCLELPNKDARYQCSHAIFMEPRLGTQSEKSIDLVSYCESLPPEVRASCFEFAGFMRYTNTLDVDVGLDICEKVPQDLQSPCRNRVGEALYAIHNSVTDVLKCGQASNQRSDDCISGFVRTIIDDVNDTQGDLALSSCDLVSESQKLRCYQKVGETLNSRYGNAIRNAACHRITVVPYRNVCLKAFAP